MAENSQTQKLSAEENQKNDQITKNAEKIEQIQDKPKPNESNPAGKDILDRNEHPTTNDDTKTEAPSKSLEDANKGKTNHNLSALEESSNTRTHGKRGSHVDPLKAPKLHTTMSLNPQSQNTIRLLVIRHAESIANLGKKNLLTHGPLEGKALEDFRFTESNIDPLLTALGEQQCKQINEKKFHGKHMKVKYVFLSPMRRTVQTGTKILDGYPTPLQYFALPEIVECLTGLSDVGYLSRDFIKNYPFIDTSRVAMDDPLWFLQVYEDIFPEKYGEKLRRGYDKHHSIESIAKVMKKAHPNFERPKQVYTRVQKGKAVIRDFIRKKAEEGDPVHDDEILVVSHSKTLKYFCEVYDENGEPVEGEDVYFENAKLRKHHMSY